MDESDPLKKTPDLLDFAALTSPWEQLTLHIKSRLNEISELEQRIAEFTELDKIRFTNLVDLFRIMIARACIVRDEERKRCIEIERQQLTVILIGNLDCELIPFDLKTSLPLLISRNTRPCYHCTKQVYEISKPNFVQFCEFCDSLF